MHFDIVVSKDGRDIAVFKNGEKVYGSASPTEDFTAVTAEAHRVDNVDAFNPGAPVPSKKGKK